MTGRSGLGAALAVALAVAGATGAAASEPGALQLAVAAPGDAAPTIVLHTPRDGGTYASPLPIDIDFEPGQDAAIDLDSLKVTVVTHTLIGDLTFDITEDVSPYVSAGGIRAQDARIPAGEHTVTISVADTLQRHAEQRLTIRVRGERGRDERAVGG
jgi:hypothetical protein